MNIFKEIRGSASRAYFPGDALATPGKGMIPLLTALLLAGNMGFAQSPGGVAGARVWLKGSAGVVGSPNVTTWNDQSGNSNNATYQSAPGFVYSQSPGWTATFVNTITPQTNGINFNPTVRFNTTSINNIGLMQGSVGNITGTNNLSAYVIFRMTAASSTGDPVDLTNSGAKVLDLGSPGNQFIYAGSELVGRSCVKSGEGNGYRRNSIDVNSLRNGSDAQPIPLGPVIGPAGTLAAVHFTATGQHILEVNEKKSVASGTATNFSAASYRIGGGFDYFADYLNGDIAEVIIYPTDQTAIGNNNDKIETYLAVKYGLTKGGNYITSGGITIWDATANSAYHHDVFGIGQDNGSGYTQTQSNPVMTGSGDGTGQTGMGNIVISNPSSMTNGAFLMIGHTTKDNSFVNDNLPAGLTVRTDRTWKVQATGSVGTVTLSYNVSGLGLAAADISSIKLLVDGTGSGNFAGAASYTCSVSGNVVTFTNVTLSNNAVFAFGVANGYIVNAPGGVTGGIKLWLKGDAGVTPNTNGSPISSWNDQSNKGNNAAYNASLKFFSNPLPVAVAAPTYLANGMNFHPVAHFPAATQSMALQGTFSSGVLNSDNISQYVVYVMHDSSGAYYSGGGGIGRAFTLLQSDSTLDYYNPYSLLYPYRNSSNSSGNISAMRGSAGTGPVNTTLYFPMLSSAHLTGSQLKTNANGSPFASVASATGGLYASVYRLGTGSDTATHFLNGDIAEVILYANDQTALGNNAHNRIESYLALKYGLTKNGNYVNSANTVFWDSTANSAYHNDVFGVGEDDGSTLSQPQSNSSNTGWGDGTGRATMGNIVLNGWSLYGNNKYYMVGHDVNPLGLITTGLPTGTAVGVKRIARTWKTQVTGTGGASGALTLTFDANGVLPQTDIANIKMIIGDAAGNFAGATPITPTVAGTVATFANVSIPAGATFTFMVQSSITNTPGGVGSGLSLWMDAAHGMTNSSGSVSAWTDRSGFNTFTMNTVQPAYVQQAVNFNPAAQFDGSSTQYLAGNTQAAMTEFYTVAAWNGATNVNRGTVLGTNSQTLERKVNNYAFYATGSNMVIQAGLLYAGNVLSTAAVIPPSGAYNIWTSSLAGGGTGGLMRKDAAPLTLVPNLPFAPIDTIMRNVPRIGASATNTAKMNGWIAEIIAYNNDKTNSGRINVESYLAVKYGITKNGNYVNSANTVIWDSTANAVYHHDVFGIERDDTTTLMQLQSNSINTGSGNGAGQSGLGNIVLSRPTLNNMDALLIGHDVNNFSLTTANMPAALQASGYQRVNRTWKVQESGSVGAVTLSFETTGIGTLSSLTPGLALVIDHSGTGNFTAGAPTVEVRTADSVSGNLAFFKNVTFSPAVFTIAGSSTPLPVTLTSFKAEKTGCDNVTASWSVADAVNLNNFEVQRSAVNGGFTTVGTVSYRGHQGNYSFNDPGLQEGSYLYRLKMIYGQGTSEVSPVVKVDIDCSHAGSVTVVPNPAHDYISLSGVKGQVNVRILNMQGQVLLKATIDGAEPIDLSGLPAAAYMVQVIKDGAVISNAKIIKQ